MARSDNGELIAGHTTLKAVELLLKEWDETSLEKRKVWHPEAVRTVTERVVPVRMKEIGEEEAHELAVADNRSGEFSDWDEASLFELLKEFPTADLDLLGYASGDLAELQRGLLVPGDEDEPPHPNAGLVKKRQVKLGQLWEVPSKKIEGGAHYLLVGDSGDEVSVGRLAGLSAFSWMWTDPPYGVDYEGGDRGKKVRGGMKIKNDKLDYKAVVRKSFEVADRHLPAGASFYVATAGSSLSTFLAEIEQRWKLSQVLVWDKGSILIGRCDYQFQHELVIYGWKEGSKHTWFGGRKQGTVFDLPKPSHNDFHPTMKPIPLVEKMVANSSKPGSRGYDPFGGSGTTLLAAENVGRLASVVELDPLYAAAILERCALLGMSPRLLQPAKKQSRKTAA